MMPKKRTYEDLGEIKLGKKTAAVFEEKIAQAEAELEETRVSFRWGKGQLRTVQRAARVMGVPYQTFMKLVVFEHALRVIRDAESIKPRPKPPRRG